MKLTKPCLQCGGTITKRDSCSLKRWETRTKYCSKRCLYIHSPNTEERRKRNSDSHKGKKLSIETRQKMSQAQSGDKHSQWKVEGIGYYGLHTWLHENFGKASRCENKECVYPRQGAKKLLLKPWRYEWALRKGMEYTRSKDNFVQLCIACHRKYDSTDIEFSF